MFEFCLKWFNQERRRRTSCDISPLCVFWLSHWLWKAYLSGIFNLWVLPTLYDEQYQMARGLSRMCMRTIWIRGAKYTLFAAKALLFHVKMALPLSLCAMTGIWSFTLRSKGGSINVSPLWRSKWYTSCCDPHNRWLNWQTSVCVCGCKTIHPYESGVYSDRWLTLLNCISKCVENLLYSQVKHSLVLH